MKALIAMSGGVDSSVAAYLMREAGYDCVGCTMRLFDRVPTAAGETALPEDRFSDAAAVAEKLGIPFEVLDCREPFRRCVMDYFAASYAAGQTPNPCLACNRHLKFGVLLDRACALGCDCVVTGHYARVEEPREGEGRRYRLLRATDPAKDQSYVLYALGQEQLAKIRFPLGAMTKTEVRAIAGAQGFVNAKKTESQDICFVPDGDYAGAVECLRGERFPAGNFVDAQGRVLGRHKGIIRYTVGQRKGLGIASDRPYYVLRVCPRDNTVLLGREEDLFVREVRLTDLRMTAPDCLRDGLRCRAKLRYRHAEQPATLRLSSDGAALLFDEPQRAPTAGQAAVIYEGDEVLGGGVIL